MTEQRRELQLRLIEALLDCPNGDELKFLYVNQNLIDSGLAHIMRKMAVVAAYQNRQDTVNFLFCFAHVITEALRLSGNLAGLSQEQSDNAQPVSEISSQTIFECLTAVIQSEDISLHNIIVEMNDFTSQASSVNDVDVYFNLLMDLLEATQQNTRDLNVIYRLLKQHQRRLDANLARMMQIWVSINLPEVEADEQLRIILVVNLLCTLIQEFPLGNQADHLEIALTGYQAIAQVIDRNRFPQEWAMTQNNLGTIYNDRIYGNRRENVENAIAAYENALNYYKPETLLQEWLTIQNNLGTAYNDRIDGDRLENLDQAIVLYKNTLQYCSKDRFGEEWAMLQVNLGTAYCNYVNYKGTLPTYSIGYSQENTIERKLKQANPHDIERGEHQQKLAQNLIQAINAYESALQVYTLQTSPQQWGIATSNLGNAYLYLHAIRDEQPEILEQAIHHYKNALKIRSYKELPQQWATTQNNLGNAYLNRKQGNRVKNLQQAIHHYRKALKARSPQRSPEQWATTQNNLAAAYRDLGQTDSAIAHFRSALQVYQPNIFPFECFTAGRNLGDMAVAAQRWQEALEGYEIAIRAIEQSRTEASNDDRRQEILSGAIDVYTNTVQIYTIVNQPDKALEYVERSKVRNLIDLLASQDMYPKRELYTEPSIHQSHCDQLNQLRRDIPAKQRELASVIKNLPEKENLTFSVEHLQQQLTYLQQHQDTLLKSIQEIDPSFTLTQRVEPLSIEAIQALIDRRTAIVEWYITGNKILVFIITRHSIHPVVLQSLSAERQALETWYATYQQMYRHQKTQWISTLAASVESLSEILSINRIIDQIDEIFVRSDAQCSRLILMPHLYLHLIPLHALPLKDGRLLLDRFSDGVGYSPSCQLLKLTMDRQLQRSHFDRLFAIQNPTRQPPKPLLGSKLEVDQIQQYFNQEQPVVLKEAAATKAALNQHMTQLSISHCLHFSCHGEFKPDAPLESCLLLADPDGTLNDTASLKLSEVFATLYLNQCRLVTFSACESGMTDFTSLSDEYIGLPSGFLYAGSLSIVSSLWTVDPLATVLLMIKFYQVLKRIPQLQAGDVSIALRIAQTWLRTLTQKKLSRIQNNPKFQSLLDRAFAEQREARMRFNELLNAATRSRKADRQPYPFAKPYYWAAFVAIGL